MARYSFKDYFSKWIISRFKNLNWYICEHVKTIGILFVKNIENEGFVKLKTSKKIQSILSKFFKSNDLRKKYILIINAVMQCPLIQKIFFRTELFFIVLNSTIASMAKRLNPVQKYNNNFGSFVQHWIIQKQFPVTTFVYATKIFKSL